MAYKARSTRTMWDPSLYPYNGFKRLKRASLSDVSRIERLRWRLLSIHRPKHSERWAAMTAKLARLKDAFIPSDEERFPRRIQYQDDGYYGAGISYDDGFWKPENVSPTAPGPHALEQLAVIAAEQEWEEKEARIHARKLLRVTEERLAVGREYEYVQKYSYTLARRLRILNTLLETAVRELDFLPDEPAWALRGKKVVVIINGRHYEFGHERRSGTSDGLWEKWPTPEDEIYEVPNFKIDGSQIGVRSDTIRTRFGEPNAEFASHKKHCWSPNIWVYGSVGLRFGKDMRVEKILNQRAVTRLLRTAK